MTHSSSFDDMRSFEEEYSSTSHGRQTGSFNKPTPRPKRIIICCDGTWQSAVSGKKNVPSNVTRLCRAVDPAGVDKNGDEWQQVVWYDSGVGTTSLSIGTAIEGAIGQGLEGNVIEAYNFCVLNYNVGDKIMIFGFSRGAFTARTIAGVISDIGICEKAELNKFPDLWNLYKTFKSKPEHQGKRFFHSETWFDWMWGEADEKQGAGTADDRNFIYTKGTQGEWAQEGSREIEVVGVYDTVGALGMPEVMGVKIPQWMLFWADKSGWHNVGLSTNIKHAFQALALDESRKSFEPTLFYVPKQAKEKDYPHLVKKEDLKERAYLSELEAAKKLKKSGKASDKEVNDAAVKVNNAASEWNTAMRHRINYEDRMKQPTKLVQVWFPGYHINIGGGSTQTLGNTGNMEEMSNIAFAWMLDQVKKHISINEKQIKKEYEKREEDFAKLNEERRKWDRKLKDQSEEPMLTWTWRNTKEVAYSIAHPFTPSEEPAFKKARRFDWGTAPMTDSYTSMYWLNGRHIRTPGKYHFKNGNPNEPLGETFEFIHPVVHYRKVQTAILHDMHMKEKPVIDPIFPYQPLGPNYDRRLKFEEDGTPYFEYDIGGCPAPLREWRLGGPGCYERMAIVGDEAKKYVKEELDAAYGAGPLLTIDEPRATPVEGPLTTVFGHGTHSAWKTSAFGSTMKTKVVQSSVTEIRASEIVDSSTKFGLFD